MPNRNRVLLVEDDPACRDVVVSLLEEHGYEVRAAGSGREMDLALSAAPADLLLLDLGLPGEDGLAICRRVAGGPDGPAVMILSAAAEEVDRVVGLELGADDYLVKPYGERELLARVRAVLRRAAPPAVRAEAERPGSDGGWGFDAGRLRVRAPDGEEVALSPKEFRLLRVLAEIPGKVRDRADLAAAAELAGADSGRAVDVLVSRIRRKLELALGDVPIRTVPRRGYAFVGRL